MPSNPKNTVSTVIPGPRVRILLPPAGSQERTVPLPGSMLYLPQASVRIPGEVARESAMMSPTIPI